jgi:hypothetical protein
MELEIFEQPACGKKGKDKQTVFERHNQVERLKEWALKQNNIKFTGYPYELPDSLESSEESSETTAPAQQPQQQTPTSRPQVTVTTADELTRRVEKIMEQDLGDTFSHLSPLAKQEFKIKGEKTARAIRTLLSKTTLKVKKVFELIVAWLKLLPGVNRFFLEQEAKIKTDRIIELHSEYR